MLKLVPLGDAAVLVYFATEFEAVRFVAAVRTSAPAWLEDLVPAYASVGVFFDPDRIRTEQVVCWIQEVRAPNTEAAAGRRFEIPVCYEFGPDLARVADHLGLSTAGVVACHCFREYTVHAIGFVPGFPYLGYLPPELTGVPRLPTPRLRVEPGSVGLTGRQTGLYPLARPGGWHLIGRTPLVVVDVAAGFFPLQVGDRVRFVPITESEYAQQEGQRLTENEPRLLPELRQ